MACIKRRRSSQQASIGAIATALALAAPQAALAQESEEAEAETARTPNTIIVTARSRAEDIQSVPIAITAFSEEDIDRRSLQELDDVARFTPGFSFEDFSGGFAQPVIRGQATTRVTALESNVSTFFDGIYIPRSWAVDIGTVNLGRIEIVKGPQSARYGRNAFSGAINYIPKKAELTGEINGELTATIGSDERYDGGVFVNLSPIENFALAASYNYSSFDGSWENAHPFADTLNADGPSTTGNVGGWENETISVSAVAEIVPGITLNASYNYFDISQEARASRYFADDTGGILDPERSLDLELITNAGRIRGGFFPLLVGEFPDPADVVVVDPRSFANQSETGIFRAEFNAEITDDLTFNYIFGNVNGDVNIGTSGEPDPINCGTLVPGFCNFQQTPVGGIDYDTHEARLTFDNSQIRASVGGFISDGTDTNRFTSINLAPITDADDFMPLNGTPVPSAPPGPLNILLADEFTRTEVVSVFGELYWTSADGRLTLGAEARYSETEITAIDNRRDATLNETFDEFTPRFTVEYEFNPDVLLFATAARGAKAGGFNVTARNIEDRTFDPEYNWTYEAGIKSALLNGDLIFNASVFYTDWTDIQINAADQDPENPTNPNVPNITVNLGDAEVYGIELATRWQATPNFSLDATFSHTDATYGDGTVDSRFSRGVGPPGANVPCDDVVCNANGNIGGNEVERTPPTQASFGAQWDGQFGDDESYFLRADASWQSEFFGESANLSIIPDRFLVNASAGLTFNDRYSIRIWARNLLDEGYTSNAFIVVLPFGNTFGQFFGERRTFGATVEADF